MKRQKFALVFSELPTDCIFHILTFYELPLLESYPVSFFYGTFLFDNVRNHRRTYCIFTNIFVRGVDCPDFVYYRFLRGIRFLNFTEHRKIWNFIPPNFFRVYRNLQTVKGIGWSGDQEIPSGHPLETLECRIHTTNELDHFHRTFRKHPLRRLICWFSIGMGSKGYLQPEGSRLDFLETNLIPSQIRTTPRKVLHLRNYSRRMIQAYLPIAIETILQSLITLGQCEHIIVDFNTRQNALSTTFYDTPLNRMIRLLTDTETQEGRSFPCITVRQ